MKLILFPLFFMILCTPLQAQSRPELHILAIGVGQYKDSAVRDLTYSAKDARDIVEQFKKQTLLYDIGLVEVLTDEQASRKGIRDALDRFSGISPNSLFILIFSGHGSHIADEGYLIPHDFDPDDETATSILKSDLLTKLSRLNCNYIVLLDACHSGSFAKSIGKNLGVEHDNEVSLVTQELLETLALEGKAQLVMASSATSEESFECVSCQNGFFSQAVLDALSNLSLTDPISKRAYVPDTDHDKYLFIDEFSNYVAENVRINTYLAHQKDNRYKKQMPYANVKKARNLRVFFVGDSRGASPWLPPNPDNDGDGIVDDNPANFDDMEKEEFAELFNAIIDDNPGNLDDMLNIGIAESQYENANYERAVPAYGEYIKKFPNGQYLLQAYQHRGESYFELKQYPQALDDFETAVGKGPSKYYTKALELAAAISYNYTLDFQKSYSYYAKLETSAVSDETRFAAQLGAMQSAYRIKNYQAVLAMANKINNNPTATLEQKSRANFYLGKLAFDNRDCDSAIFIFDRLMPFNNNSLEEAGESWYLIASIHYQCLELNLAESWCYKAMKENSTNSFWRAKSILLLADVYADQGNIFNARGVLESLIEGYNDDPGIINEAQTKLDQYNRN